MNLKRIVASILVISVVIGAVPSSVVKATEDEGNNIIEKNLINDDYEYEISNEGVKITKYLGNNEEVIIPDYIDGKKVTSIGENAFIDCIFIKKIVMGKFINNIGIFAFSKCENLEEITLSDNVEEISFTSFLYSNNIKKIIIPSSVTNINKEFYSFLSLEEIEVDENNQNYSSDDGVLYNKDKSKLIKYPRLKTNDNYTISSFTKEIEEEAFYYCTNLKNLNMGESVTTIREDAFEHCSNLKVLKIGKSVKNIEIGAFSNCENLEEVIVPDNVEKVSINIFSFSDNIKKIVIPSSVINITEDFYDIFSLKEIEVEEDNKYYSSENGVLYNKDKTKLIKYPNQKDGESYVVQSSVNEIGEGAFSGNIKLKYLDMGRNVKILEWNALPRKLEEIILPDDIKEIKGSLYLNVKKIIVPSSVISINEEFYNLDYLEEIEIDKENKNYLNEDGVLYSKDKSKLIKYMKQEKEECYIISDCTKEIFEDAFKDCEDLKSIVLGKEVIKIGANAFSGCVNLEEITVPNNLKDTYRTGLAQCYNIRKVIVPSSVVYINSLFFGLNSLEEMQVDKDNNYYSSDGKAIYNKDKTILIKYLKSNKDDIYIIPDCVEEICEESFEDCNDLKKVVIGKKVKTIKNHAFAFCDNLEEIVISSDTIDMNNFPFSCTTIKKLGITSDVTNIDEKLLDLEYLQEFDVDKNNNYYLSEDGVLYNKDKTKLIKYPRQKEGESYIIPDNTKEIGEKAFNRCKLRTIDIGKSVELLERNAFSYCENLEEIKISNNLKNKNNDVFWGSNNIKKIIVPSSVININSIFYKLTSLEEIDVDKDNNYYYSENGVLYNKDESKLISYPAARKEEFYKISDNTKEIGEGAFSYSNLKHVILGKSVVYINEDAFYECKEMQEITLSDNLETIHDYAFGKNVNIKRINIPATVTNINSMFYRIYSLEEINVDKDNKNYLSEDGILYNKDKSKIIKYPAAKEGDRYIVPSVTKEIGDLAFLGCKLKILNTGKSVNTIGRHAFAFSENLEELTIPYNTKNVYYDILQGCKNLKKIIVPTMVESIDSAFYNCDSLEKIEVVEGNKNYLSEDGILYNADKSKLIRYLKSKSEDKYTIPSHVKEIGDGAFEDCTNLKELTIHNNVITINKNALKNISDNLVIYGEWDSIAYEYSLMNNIKFDVIPEKAWYFPGINNNDIDFNYSYNSAKYLELGVFIRDNKDEYYRFTGKEGDFVKIELDFKKEGYYDIGNMNLCLKDRYGNDLSLGIYVNAGEHKTLMYTLKKSDFYYVVLTGVVGKYSIKASGIDDNVDTDGDGLYDSQEYYHSTNIFLKDTDNDGVDDYTEIKFGRNPLKKEEVKQLVVNSFVANKKSPQNVGTMVKLSVEACGNGKLQYKFIVSDNKGNWYKIKDFQDYNECLWNATVIGNKTLYVDVKDESGQVVRKSMNYTIKEDVLEAPQIINFSADKTSPQVSKTKVILKVEAIGTGTLQYKFIISDNKGNWYKIKDFGTSNTTEWITGPIGNKTLYVDVKDENGQITRKSINYTVK